jgi:site-specific DNA-methyltransferase (adenine-specific)
MQQRLWGHAFHPMCSYLAMFPASFAHAFIARYSRAGDVVLDPFSGRGTVPLQACAEGRVGVGNDLSPFAHLLTAAKVDPPTTGELTARMAILRVRWSVESADWIALATDAIATAPEGRSTVPRPRDPGLEALPLEVAHAFHRKTLAQLLFLRGALGLESTVDRFLTAALTGILHGHSKSYVSDLMPNAFSMPTQYVRDFVARTGYEPPERDVLALIERKVRRLFRDGPPVSRGVALLGDARDVGVRANHALRRRALPGGARLVVTSPPYLRVVRYGAYNWLRLWFLGLDAPSVDATLDTEHRLDGYLAFLRDALRGLLPALADDAVIALVIGDVERERGKRLREGHDLAGLVWEAAAAPEGYRLAGVAVDEVAAHRKVTKIWGDEAGRATRLERILVMAVSESGRRRALAGAALPVDWTWPPRGPRPA